METLWKDLRYGIRMLWKSPGFTAVAILTLALGIGANTTIFSFVNAVLLRSLPTPNASRLVVLFHSYPRLNLPRASVSVPGFLYYREHAQSYQNLAAFTDHRAPQNLTGVGMPERVRSVAVSADFFPALQIRPILGRVFAPQEEQPGQNQVAVLSYGFWQQRFAADPAMLGKSITLDGNSYTVVGIMPAGFDAPDKTDVWIPLAFAPAQLNDFTEYLQVLARLKSGVSTQKAQAELDRITGEIRRQFPNRFFGDATGWHVILVPLREVLVGDIKPALLVLFGAVAFVLLIACINLANLLLARATARQKEIAIRTALGAGRGRVIRQVLTESVLLACLGGGFGLLVAFWGIDLLLRFAPFKFPSFISISLDLEVLGFTVLLSILTGLIFGSVPAFHTLRVDLNESLKEGGRETSATLKHNRIRKGLVIAEMALAMVLLIGAGLMIRSFLRLQRARYGFDANNLLTLQLALPQSKYQTPVQLTSFFQQALQRISTLPGAEDVGLASNLPLRSNWTSSYQIQGRTVIPVPHAYVDIVSARYFQTLRIPLLKGRYFEDRDEKNSLPVAIIDERTAQTFWPNEDPLGKRIAFNFDRLRNQPVWREIIGVVGSVKHTSALSADTKGEVYLSYLQFPIPYMAVAVRTHADPSAIATAVRESILQVDSEQPAYDVKSMDSWLSEYVAQPRFNMLLLGSFGALALLLAAVGIYAVMSYSVAQRTHEIGIRMALGAEAIDVLKLVIGQGMLLALFGLVAGLSGAMLITRVMSSLLYGVGARDLATLTGVSFLLATVALLACYIPARRATKVDPMLALRYE